MVLVTQVATERIQRGEVEQHRVESTGENSSITISRGGLACNHSPQRVRTSDAGCASTKSSNIRLSSAKWSAAAAPCASDCQQFPTDHSVSWHKLARLHHQPCGPGRLYSTEEGQEPTFWSRSSTHQSSTCHLPREPLEVRHPQSEQRVVGKQIGRVALGPCKAGRTQFLCAHTGTVSLHTHSSSRNQKHAQTPHLTRTEWPACAPNSKEARAAGTTSR